MKKEIAALKARNKMLSEQIETTEARRKRDEDFLIALQDFAVKLTDFNNE